MVKNMPLKSSALKLGFLDGVYIAEKMLQISSRDDQCFVLFFLIIRSFVIALKHNLRKYLFCRIIVIFQILCE